MRGGGHRIAGLAVAEGGLMIDLSLMRGVSVDLVDEGERMLAPLRLMGKPVADTVCRRPHANMQCLLDATQPNGRRY